jgi:DNA-binding response OmpR family regulator
LPKLSGTEVLKEIREEKIYTPIIMLTIKSEMEDKEIAFNLGADDYLTKPFLIEELLIRIKALLRRPAKIKTPNLRLGDLVLNTQSGIFKRQGKEIYLTKREFCLLQYFFKRKGEIISRGEILENVWDYNSDPLSNSIETHIASLRRKINFGSLPDLIHTFPGRGYKLALKKTT